MPTFDVVSEVDMQEVTNAVDQSNREVRTRFTIAWEVDGARLARESASPAKRMGHPSEFGDACAYLCSAQAGYITGQNLLIDGGGYPGTF